MPSPLKSPTATEPALESALDLRGAGKVTDRGFEAAIAISELYFDISGICRCKCQVRIAVVVEIANGHFINLAAREIIRSSKTNTIVEKNGEISLLEIRHNDVIFAIAIDIGDKQIIWPPA